MRKAPVIILLLALLTACGQQDIDLSTKDLCTIAIEDEPNSFDPRLIRNTCSVNIAHMIGEGLYRFDKKGDAVPAIAEKVDIDPNGTLYTFRLKNARWSNGDPITASDFETTIKSVMSPDTPAPNAHLLYMIKGAKEAKEGRLSVDDIGVKSQGEKTLVIELKDPTPYFLKLTATHFLYPVHSSDLELNQKKNSVASGPFVLETFTPASEIILKKNEQFWDAENVSLKMIKLLPLNDLIALQLLSNQEIDWVGSPIGRLPPDAIPKLMESKKLNVESALGTFWIRTNTLDKTLSSKELRKALSESIDREEIVTHITGSGQKPAFSIVPPILYGEESNALQKPSYNKVQVDEPITLIYIHNERNHKMAQYLEQTWKKIGIPITLQASESKTFYEQIANGSYQLSLSSWFADIPDPVNFLEIFKYKDLKTNGTGWENQDFIALLDMAEKEQDTAKRIALLKQSEEVLINDYPVIPLYFAIFNWLKNPDLEGVIVSPMGFMDLRNAKK